MFRTPQQKTFTNADDSTPLDIEWMTDPNVETLLDIDQTLSANSTLDANSFDITGATDSDVPMISSADEAIFAIPADLGPSDVAWIVDLLESAEQSDMIVPSLELSQLHPYRSTPAQPPALPETTTTVVSKRSAGTHAATGPKPKRYSVSEIHI
jgi:hypothetical protein